jgi:hypothetical protein
MGVRKGTADFFLADGRPGLWLELKSEVGTLKPEQRAFLDMAARRGYAAVAAWGHVAAFRAVKDYLHAPIQPPRGYLATGDWHPLGDVTNAGTRRTR